MERRGAIHGPAAGDAQRLVPEAHAQDGDPLGKQTEEVREGARVARVTGAGGEHDGFRFAVDEVGGRRFVRLHDLGRVAESLDQLDEVVGEAVVVIDDEDHDEVGTSPSDGFRAISQWNVAGPSPSSTSVTVSANSIENPISASSASVLSTGRLEKYMSALPNHAGSTSP